MSAPRKGARLVPASLTCFVIWRVSLRFTTFMLALVGGAAYTVLPTTYVPIPGRDIAEDVFSSKRR